MPYFYLLQNNFILGEMNNRLSDLVAKRWVSVDNLIKKNEITDFDNDKMMQINSFHLI